MREVYQNEEEANVVDDTLEAMVRVIRAREGCSQRTHSKRR